MTVFDELADELTAEVARLNTVWPDVAAAIRDLGKLQTSQHSVPPAELAQTANAVQAGLAALHAVAERLTPPTDVNGTQRDPLNILRSACRAADDAQRFLVVAHGRHVEAKEQMRERLQQARAGAEMARAAVRSAEANADGLALSGSHGALAQAERGLRDARAALVDAESALSRIEAVSDVSDVQEGGE